MTPYEILKRFQNEQSETMIAMRGADHNYSPTELNPYHLEGDVWTHTMMVFNYAVSKAFPTEVLLAALLHDVGKAYTKKTRDKPNVKFNNEIDNMSEEELIEKFPEEYKAYISRHAT